MKVFNNILETIGNTPIVRLNKIPEKDMKIYAKLEFFNPSGSIKDRMAYYIIRKAEEEGKINGIIVENSSGNMGASLAMIGAVKGYRIIITIPDKMSQEKINLMKAFGADVIVTKTDVPYDSPESYYSMARKYRKNLEHIIRINTIIHIT
jgi:Cysteine synthase